MDNRELKEITAWERNGEQFTEDYWELVSIKGTISPETLGFSPVKLVVDQQSGEIVGEFKEN